MLFPSELVTVLPVRLVNCDVTFAAVPASHGLENGAGQVRKWVENIPEYTCFKVSV